MPPKHRLPSLKALRVFEMAGKLGNFSDTASALLVTQSAVSRQILLLEEELGCKLFVRERSGVRLTAIGEDYHRKVSNALGDIASATTELKLRIAGMNIIRMTTLPTLAMQWLLPKLPNFKAAHPQIAVDLSSSDELVDLVSGNMDVGIRSGHGQWPGLEITHLFNEELITVCAPERAEMFAKGFVRGFAQAPMLHTTTRPFAWQHWAEAHAPDITAGTNQLAGYQDFFITIQAAILGHGVAIIPSFLVEKELASGRLVDPTGKRLHSDRKYYFITSRSNATHPPIVAFRDWVLACCREMAINSAN
ncbi:LysR substrate-binding domain-containing protein [Thalassospira marina]|uniref:HTH lysR-type domain-containing protein n=1 Tax=Thalassospira marina TaxID=2048283 RepID=A0ABM6QFJ9_9PROT|nr:LysR substrate-binding domain-containing protein [Thalassospira marina]AUG55389.1 hypothetical protein CSC3H3_21175 [Thalassospira marina]